MWNDCVNDRVNIIILMTWLAIDSIPILLVILFIDIGINDSSNDNCIFCYWQMTDIGQLTIIDDIHYYY